MTRADAIEAIGLALAAGGCVPLFADTPLVMREAIDEFVGFGLAAWRTYVTDEPAIVCGPGWYDDHEHAWRERPDPCVAVPSLDERVARAIDATIAARTLEPNGHAIVECGVLPRQHARLHHATRSWRVVGDATAGEIRS